VTVSLRQIATEFGCESVTSWRTARHCNVEDALSERAWAAEQWAKRRAIHQALRVLREVEWSSWSENYNEWLCPTCNAGTGKHAPDCALAAALR
jgi:hypothetical protein